MPRTNSLCAMWAYLLCFVNRMAKITLTSHPKAILNQPEIEWSPLPTLYGGSGGRYEMAPLMAPKTVTLWAPTYTTGNGSR